MLFKSLCTVFSFSCQPRNGLFFFSLSLLFVLNRATKPPFVHDEPLHLRLYKGESDIGISKTRACTSMTSKEQILVLTRIR